MKILFDQDDRANQFCTIICGFAQSYDHMIGDRPDGYYDNFNFQNAFFVNKRTLIFSVDDCVSFETMPIEKRFFWK